MKELLLSPLVFILFMAISIVFSRNIWLRRLALLSIVFFYLLSCPVGGSLFLRSVESRVSALNLSDSAEISKQADAIVVLGGGRYFKAPEFGGRSSISTSSLERIRYAAILAKAIKKPILVSGGSPLWRGDSEAELMKKSLEDEFQTPVRWVESGSNNTRENALMSAKILLPLGIHRIFLVTHAAHLIRARRSFENLGFSVVSAPLGFASHIPGYDLDDFLPTLKGMELSRIALHEYFGEIWYWFHRKATGV